LIECLSLKQRRNNLEMLSQEERLAAAPKNKRGQATLPDCKYSIKLGHIPDPLAEAALRG
jgi:hypothetical protein